MYVFYRTVLLSEHSDVVVFGVLAVLFKTGHPGPTKVNFNFLHHIYKELNLL